MVRAYYASTATARHKLGAVVLLDDMVEADRGLIATGYYTELKDPPRGRAARQD